MIKMHLPTKWPKHLLIMSTEIQQNILVTKWDQILKSPMSYQHKNAPNNNIWEHINKSWDNNFITIVYFFH